MSDIHVLKKQGNKTNKDLTQDLRDALVGPFTVQWRLIGNYLSRRVNNHP